MEKRVYIAPEVEVLEIKVEQGFAASPGFEVPDGRDDDNPAWM